MSYDHKYECRYHSPSLFLEEEEMQLSQEEKESVRHFLYQEDVHAIFGDKFPTEEDLSWLDAKLEDCKEWKELVEHASLLVGDNSVGGLGLCILLSYDYLHLTHPCISTYLANGKMDTKLFETLLAKIKYSSNV